jgi:hypothetical protein
MRSIKKTKTRNEKRLLILFLLKTDRGREIFSNFLPFDYNCDFAGCTDFVPFIFTRRYAPQGLDAHVLPREANESVGRGAVHLLDTGWMKTIARRQAHDSRDARVLTHS